MSNGFIIGFLYAVFGVILLAGSTVVYDYYDKKEKKSPGRFKLQKDIWNHLIGVGLINIVICVFAIFMFVTHPKKKFLIKRQKIKTKRNLYFIIFVLSLGIFWIFNIIYLFNIIKISKTPSETKKKNLQSEQKQLKIVYLVFYFVAVIFAIFDLIPLLTG